MKVIRLQAVQLDVEPFTLPAAAFQAFDKAAQFARVDSFVESPCDALEVTILAFWLELVMVDPIGDDDRIELMRACPEFWAGDGAGELVAWLARSGGFQVEGGWKLMPVPSAN
jgi:hypothetical protein